MQSLFLHVHAYKEHEKAFLIQHLLFLKPPLLLHGLVYQILRITIPISYNSISCYSTTVDLKYRIAQLYMTCFI